MRIYGAITGRLTRFLVGKTRPRTVIIHCGNGGSKRPSVEYDGGHKEVVWLQPTLIAEIEYGSWTDDGKLRHSACKGLREVQDNAAVYTVDRPG